jgi:hypothetical protein
MDTNIVGQYQNLVKEQEKIKKITARIDNRLLFLKKYLKHAKDIRLARKERKLILMEKVFRELDI